MSETVLQANILPEPLYKLITTELFKIRKDTNGEVRLIPYNETKKATSSCPFLGLYSDGKLTVDGYLNRKRTK
jgi:hypothetical protein